MFFNVEKIILLKRALNANSAHCLCGVFLGRFRLKYIYISDYGFCNCYSCIIIALAL